MTILILKKRQGHIVLAFFHATISLSARPIYPSAIIPITHRNYVPQDNSALTDVVEIPHGNEIFRA